VAHCTGLTSTVVTQSAPTYRSR